MGARHTESSEGLGGCPRWNGCCLHIAKSLILRARKPLYPRDLHYRFQGVAELQGWGRRCSPKRRAVFGFYGWIRAQVLKVTWVSLRAPQKGYKSQFIFMPSRHPSNPSYGNFYTGRSRSPSVHRVGTIKRISTKASFMRVSGECFQNFLGLRSGIARPQNAKAEPGQTWLDTYFLSAVLYASTGG